LRRSISLRRAARNHDRGHHCHRVSRSLATILRVAST
jgi:hypothetical protein